MKRTGRLSLWLSLLAACTLYACTPPVQSTPRLPATAVAQINPSATTSLAPATQTPTLAPTPTIAATATATPTSTPPPQTRLCSPLLDISLEELASPDLLKNPFDPPRAGADGGHQGVDFAYWSRGERKTMLGHPVQSVLDGRVAAALPLRQPYGYAVIIETSLHLLPPDWVTLAAIPTPAPTVRPDDSLFCPTGSEVDALSPGVFPQDYSLYLLYAHLAEPPNVETGQMVSCGQVIGAAGTSGNSVNIHLHLETRLGPSGATFTSMDHYDNAATDLEMSNYCAWRVSGLFQMFDPMQLLSLQP